MFTPLIAEWEHGDFEDELVEVTPKSLRLRKKILQANRRPKRNAQAVAQ